MAQLDFTKMHGCGNDYIYMVATATRPADPARLSMRLSDRRFGIGGDGLILLCPSQNADLRMEMYNADGSRAEMCGNGIRCVARLAYESGVARRNPISIETDCGIKTVWLKLQNGRPVAATVDMGPPILEGREIPADADGRIVNYPLRVGERTERSRRSRWAIHIAWCSSRMIRYSSFPTTSSPGWDASSSAIRSFPAASIPNSSCRSRPGRLRMRVWERGSGETLACGTGACAAVVAAALTGRGGPERGGRVAWRHLGNPMAQRRGPGWPCLDDRGGGGGLQRPGGSGRRRSGRGQVSGLVRSPTSARGRVSLLPCYPHPSSTFCCGRGQGEGSDALQDPTSLPVTEAKTIAGRNWRVGYVHRRIVGNSYSVSRRQRWTKLPCAN